MPANVRMWEYLSTVHDLVIKNVDGKRKEERGKRKEEGG